MAREHVYSDTGWLNSNRLTEKLAVTHAPGARYGSVRFVTGARDRVGSRSTSLDLAQRANVPIPVVYGEETPTKSRAEMEALAEFPNVEVKRLSSGKLAIHEEMPDAVTSTLMEFLGDDQRSKLARQV